MDTVECENEKLFIFQFTVGMYLNDSITKKILYMGAAERFHLLFLPNFINSQKAWIVDINCCHGNRSLFSICFLSFVLN